jgi:methionine-R-sulfoxide reductase
MIKLITILLINFLSISAIAEGNKDMTNKQDLKEKLTPAQYHITQEGGTEPPFQNEYWDNKADGIYVDVVTGEPLFSSTHKYDSGTGWPSFTRSIKDDVVDTAIDKSHGMVRTEVKSSDSGSHLGHVFDDGPEDQGGKRFCINSSALKFIPKEEMIDKGYGEYMYLFLE